MLGPVKKKIWATGVEKITRMETFMLLLVWTRFAAHSSLWQVHLENESEVTGREIHLPLLKEEVETCTPGRDRSTNLTG